MNNKDKYWIKFILSTISIPIPHFFVGRVAEYTNDRYYNYFNSDYSICFALMFAVIALYFLSQYILEQYKEIKNH